MAGQAIAMGIGGLLNLLGGNLQQNQEDWRKNTLVHVLNALNEWSNWGYDRTNEVAGPAREGLLGLRDLTRAFQWGTPEGPGVITDLYDTLRGTRQGLTPEQFAGVQRYVDDEGVTREYTREPAAGWDALIQQLGGLGGQYDPTYGATGQIIEQFGRPFESSWGLERLFELAGGQGAEIGTLGDVGSEIVGQRGATGFTRNAQERAQDIWNAYGMNQPLANAQGGAFEIAGAGGRTPEIANALATAGETVDAGGYGALIQRLAEAGLEGLGGQFGTGGQTPAGATGAGVALQGLLDEGATAGTDYLSEIGANYLGEDPLLSMDEVTSFAKDRAAAQNAALRESAIQRAQRRSGAALTSGAENQEMADFEDEAMRRESDAIQQARLQQQGLQLQRFGQAGELFGQGQRIAAGREGQLGDLLAALEQSATGRYGTGGQLLLGGERAATDRFSSALSGLTGLSQVEASRLLNSLGLVPEIERTATQRVGTYGDLGSRMAQIEDQRLGTGAGMLDTFNRTRLQGLEGIRGYLDSETQRLLGAMGARNQAVGTQGNIYSNLLQSMLGSGQLNLGRTQGYYGNLNELLNQQGRLAELNARQEGTALGGLTELANQWGALTRTGVGSLPSVFAGYSPQSWMGQAVSGIGNRLADAYGPPPRQRAQGQGQGT